MKLINIIFKDIKSFVNYEKRMFALLFFGLVVSAFSLTFLYLFTINTKNRILSYDEYKTRQYSMNLGELNLEQKYSLLEQIHQLELPDMDEMFLTYEYDKKGQIYNINGFFTNRDQYYISQGKRFNEISKNSSENIIFLSNDLLDFMKKLSYLNETYFIGNEKYNIVGVCEMCLPRSMFIPYYTFMDKRYDFNHLSIIYSTLLSKNEVNKLEETVKRTDTSIELIKPLNADISIVSAHYMKLLIYILLIASSLFTTISMIKYWIMKNIRQYVVYLICGSKRIMIYLLMMFETIILGVVAYMVGFVLFMGTAPRISIYNIDLSYNINQLLSIFLLYIFLIILCIQPTAIKFARKLSIYSLL
ncbi:MAG: hypothetical protein K0S76_1665 [Herbinix sp.]|jgi:hypothetical protein|nr:hypothetical protein [Herbinix sp.]